MVSVLRMMVLFTMRRCNSTNTTGKKLKEIPFDISFNSSKDQLLFSNLMSNLVTLMGDETSM